MSEKRLAGKIALVTGAARGIGKAIAQAFAFHGAIVLIGDIDAELGQATADEIGDAASFVKLDVCDPAAWDAATADSLRRFGGLDVLVNNAGSGVGAPIELEVMADHRRILDLNLTGVWSGVRAVIPAMAPRGGGSIINISSIDGLVGVPGLSTYVATKFAVTGMTKALAVELGARSIRVNSIHPGVIETPLVAGVPPAPMARLHKMIARQPIPRMGRPEEVAHAAVFFASDESSYCTGSSLVVDGGHIAGPYRDPA